MPKILIVEVNQAIRESLSLELRQRGFDVVTAQDGKLGIAMVQSEKPHLVLMGLDMPELNGWEATQQIKASADNDNLPIVALATEASQPDDCIRALRAGCVDCQTKPVDIAKLLTQIETHLLNAAAKGGGITSHWTDQLHLPAAAPS